MATGVHPDTVARGARELEGDLESAGVEPVGRVRAPGGGRKPATETDPGLAPALTALVDPETRGDPESPLVWTTKSTRNLADALTAGGHRVSDRTVARMLRAQGFSLQANAKVTEGRQHVDRDAQFGYLNTRVIDHLAAGAPVLSVDTEKKELVGEYKNGGREYQPTGTPVRVNVHDFPDKELGKAIPYGIYDVAANTGWVSVGADHDTSAFAVGTLRRWWHTMGRHRYPDTDRLLICADGGGSNGYRVRAWKIELAAFAAETGLTIPRPARHDRRGVQARPMSRTDAEEPVGVVTASRVPRRVLRRSSGTLRRACDRWTLPATLRCDARCGGARQSRGRTGAWVATEAAATRRW